jgi:hypothetical protein
MKTLVASLAFLNAVFIFPQLFADDLFFQTRVERTRRCIPNYNYRAGQSSAVSAVVSEPAILILMPADSTAAGTTAITTRAFVFDDVTAGPMVLSGLAAKTNGDGEIVISGILNHTGGDSGQLLGGKALIRVEPLTAAGTTAKNATTLIVREATCWVRRNEPEPVHICVQYASPYQAGFGDVERVRVFLEYHPNR